MDSIDPRTRIAASVFFSVAIAASGNLLSLALALSTAAVAAVLARIRPLEAVKRLAPVNAFALALFLLLPLSAGQSSLAEFGPVHYSKEGLLLALTIALKANAIVLWILVLLGTLDVITLGHALRRLGVPEKLAHLLLFTVRYMDVLYGEYSRLRTAMSMRGFRPRVNAHTYRTYGYLVGMLLVRSLDRSERIAAAMKCRGLGGQRRLWRHFAFSRRDIWFAVAASAALAFLALLEWS